jgi:hypothetical protein
VLWCSDTMTVENANSSAHADMSSAAAYSSDAATPQWGARMLKAILSSILVRVVVNLFGAC